MRVLLAEDTHANQKLVCHVLGKRGHAIEVVENGHEALRQLGKHNFDVVLMDVQMPEMDGFQATARIRGLPDPAKARVPVIAMTAHALKGDRERCVAAGMDCYLSKPIDADEMTELVERLADERKTRETIDPPEATTTPRASGIPAGGPPLLNVDQATNPGQAL